MLESFNVTEQEKAKIIRNFIDSTGKLKNLPAQRKKKLILLEYMLRGLEHGKSYKEKEINQHIQQFHEDFATVRREFVISHFMDRQEGIYELNSMEKWLV